jgi:hypothetical protein
MTSWSLNLQHIFLITHTDVNEQHHHIKSLFSSLVEYAGIAPSKYISESSDLKPMESWITFKRIV